MTTMRDNLSAENGHPLTALLWLLPPLLMLIILFGIPQLAPTAPLAWLTSEKAAWYLTRASGLVAYLLLSLSTIWGLLLSGKMVKKRIPPATALTLHNYLSWTSIGFTIFHAAVLLFDNYYRYTIATLLIPFIGPYLPIWVGLGVIALYLMLATSLSWYWRKKIGQNNWRKLHYLTFFAYLLTTLHGFMAGTDAAQLGIMFALSGIIVLFLTFYRILAAVNR